MRNGHVAYICSIRLTFSYHLHLILSFVASAYALVCLFCLLVAHDQMYDRLCPLGACKSTICGAHLDVDGFDPIGGDCRFVLL